MPSSPLGLRERKRIATETAIQTVAVRIALEEGVSAVTVDRVCDEVMVSRSTFFNYFSSREQAIFGKPLDFSSERSRDLLNRHGADLTAAASALVIDAATGGEGATQLTRERMRIFVNEPDMTGRVSWGSVDSRSALAVVLGDWLDAHPEGAKLGPDARDREIRLVIGASIVAAEEVMHQWQESKTELPFDLDAHVAALGDLRAILN